MGSPKGKNCLYIFWNSGFVSIPEGQSFRKPKVVLILGGLYDLEKMTHPCTIAGALSCRNESLFEVGPARLARALTVFENVLVW